MNNTYDMTGEELASHLKAGVKNWFDKKEQYPTLILLGTKEFEVLRDYLIDKYGPAGYANRPFQFEAVEVICDTTRLNRISIYTN